MQILFLFGLILLNGVFAMSEIALVSARRTRLQLRAEQGDKGAEAAIQLSEDPTRFLSTIQIGITSIGLLSGIVGEAALAAPLAGWLMNFGIAETSASILSTLAVVLLVTYISIVLGELVPKRLGQLSAESASRFVARPLRLLSLVVRPFVWFLVISTNGFLRLFGVQQNENDNLTQEEIIAILAEGSKEGVLHKNEHQMMRNVFRLDDREVSSLMTPRVDVIFVNVKDSLQDNMRKITESGHTRFPVCNGNLNQALGYIHVKKILSDIAQGKKIDFMMELQTSLFVPESLTGMALIEQFRLNNVQMAFVVDEYGEVEGIVTLQDVMDALAGEFIDRKNSKDASAVQRADGSWIFDGVIAVVDLEDYLGLTNFPEHGKGQYHTLSGMLMLLLEDIPKVGDAVDWGGWHFEVVEMDGKMVERVIVSVSQQKT